jgi:hypothetical protein
MNIRKAFVLIVTALALCGFQAVAQTTEHTIKVEPNAATSERAPKDSAVNTKCFEVVGTSDYYFGSIDAEGSVEHTFVLKNNCTTLIEVDRAQASCGCTAAVVSEKNIQPGQEAKIQVKFTPPRGTRGKVAKTVSVFLKGETQPHTVLRFSAEVKTDLDLQPAYIQLLGAEVGTAVNGKATVKNVTTEDIEISEMQFTATSYADTTIAKSGSTVAIPLTKVSVKPTTMKLKPGESQEVTITLTPDYEGQVNGSLRLKTKKSEAYLQLYGIVRGKGQGEVKK